MTKPAAHPKGFWVQEAETLRRIAPCMTLAQLIAHYNTTSRRMLQTLNKLQVDFMDKRTGLLTKAQIQQLPTLAQTHTPRQIAEQLAVPIECIHAHLARKGIKAQHGKADPIWEMRRAELAQIAPGMTITALQAHYQQQGHMHTIGAIRQALYQMQIEWQRSKAKSGLYQREAELAEMATRLTRKQMAQQLGYGDKYLWRVLNTMGITPLHGESGRPTKAEQPSRTPKLQQPAARMDAATPSRTSIASKKPAQIVWPAHIRVQHIALPQPPADHRICNGSSRQAYVPAKGWAAGPRAI